MDGDLRPRSRRLSADHDAGQGWGYSSPIGADTGFAQPVPATADAPRRSPEVPARDRDEPRRDKQQPAEDKQPTTRAGERQAVRRRRRAPKTPRWKKRLYWIGGAALVAALIVGGVLYYLHARHYENTDDAFIDGHHLAGFGAGRRPRS